MPPLQGRQVVLQHPRGGVAQARIGVTFVRSREARRPLCRGLEGKCGGLVDGRGHRAEHRIGGLPSVDALRVGGPVGLVVVVAHGISQNG